MNKNDVTIKDHASIESFCKAITTSNLIPKHYQNNPSAIMVAVYRAQDFNVSPFTFMENTYMLNGKLGMTTSFMIALLNNSNKIVGNIEFENHGTKGTMNFGVTARVVNKQHQTLQVHVDMVKAHADNWTRNAKYKSMPDLMLRYRSASELIRTYFPEILQGFYSIEELETFDVNASNIKTNALLNEITKEDISFAEDELMIPESEKYQPPEIIDEVKTEEVMDDGDREHILNELKYLIDHLELDQSMINSWLEKAEVNSLEELDKEKMVKLCQFLHAKL